MATSSEIATCLSKVGEKIADKAEAEACCQKLAEFAKEGAVAAPFLVKGLPALLTTTSNKEKKVSAAAFAAIEGIIANLNQYAVAVVMPTLIASLGNKKKPEEKIWSLKMMAMMAEKFSHCASSRDTSIGGDCSCGLARLEGQERAN